MEEFTSIIIRLVIEIQWHITFAEQVFNIDYQLRNEHGTKNKVRIVLIKWLIINLGLDLPFFDGWCRYGSDNRDWMNGYAIKNDILCHQKCQNTTGCSAFSFEYNDVEEPCNIYAGGPYTYGNGRVNTKCHTIPKGQCHILCIYTYK